jgi:hypothetical protein
MNFRNLITAAAIAALPLSAHAATFVVPAAGTGPGAMGSQWQSELTLHTAAPRPVALSISFHQGTNVAGPVEVTLQARETISIEDVVKTKFGVESGTGSLVIDVATRDARTLAITSRVSNITAEGEFGQDIPAVDVAAASVAGDITALTGPSTAIGNRFNFGIYSVEATTVLWDLLRADGTVAVTKEVTYEAGEHAQYSSAFLTTDARDNDTVHARIVSGKAVFYGSVVNVTGDPTFVPGIRTREDILINFVGIDLDENGTVDVFDADGNGVLDSPVAITTAAFPNYFKLVAEGETGEAITYEVISSTAHAEWLDTAGTLKVVAFPESRGQSGEIVVRATTAGSSTLLTIPVLFR